MDRALRTCLIFILSFAFFVTVWKSFERLRLYPIGLTSSRTEFKVPTKYPAITLCPMPSSDIRLPEGEKPFEELSKRPKPIFTHVKHKEQEFPLGGEEFSTVMIHTANILHFCETFESPAETPIGYANRIVIGLNYSISNENPDKRIFMYLIKVHDPGVHVATINRVYGPDFYLTYLEMKGDAEISRREIHFEMAQEEFNVLARTEKPCLGKEGNDLTTCAMDYVETRVGCRLPWSNRNSTSPSGGESKICQTKEQAREFEQLLKELETITESAFEKLTGCRPRCQAFRYSLVEKAHYNSFDGGSNHLTLHFYYSSTTYLVQNEIELYGSNSFIAEVGGFMGMLLGASILSLIEFGETLVDMAWGRIAQTPKK